MPYQKKDWQGPACQSFFWHVNDKDLERHIFARSPFSLLLAKSVGPNNFWLQQYEIVGVGATMGPSVGANFGPFVGHTLLVLQMGRKCLKQKGQNSSKQ